MKTRHFFIMLFFGCGFLALVGLAQVEVPSSQRSREVASRIEPTLLSALTERDLKLGSPIFIRIFKQSRELEIWIAADNCFDHAS